MRERYEFQNRDAELLWSANVLLHKVMSSGKIRPAQMVTLAKLQHVLSVLPRVTQDITASVSVSCPRHRFEEIETYHWWDFGIEDGRLSITSGGHFYDPKSGGDTFTTMDWTAVPEEPTELNDYRDTLRMVPDVGSYSEGVESIDFSVEGYTIEVLDDDNPLLEDQDDNEDETEDEELEEHYEEQSSSAEESDVDESHDHFCPQCEVYWGCKSDTYCHLPTELPCARHGVEYAEQLFPNNGPHVHECRECPDKDAECVSTFDWVHNEPQCRMPRFWPCEKHRGAQSAE